MAGFVVRVHQRGRLVSAGGGGEAYAKAEAGRALSAFNLLIFLGVFTCRWGMGLVIDALMAAGWGRVVLGLSETQRAQGLVAARG